MGQKIEITSAVTLGNVAVFDTDRTLGGQDGDRFRSADEAETLTTVPADLARRLFAADEKTQSVFITSNLVTVERATGWDEDAIKVAGDVIAELFLFY